MHLRHFVIVSQVDTLNFKCVSISGCTKYNVYRTVLFKCPANNLRIRSIYIYAIQSSLISHVHTLMKWSSFPSLMG